MRSSPNRSRAASSSGPSSGAARSPCRRSIAMTSRRASASSVASAGSSATRNRGRPCWRVPRISPSPRRVRSTSASSNPSRIVAIAYPPAGELGLGIEQDAMTLMLSATHPPAELVELEEAVALRALDQHHGRVGDVDADLDHRRRDEHVDAACDESLHRLGLLRRGHLTVQEPDLETGQLACPQALGLHAGRLGLQLLRVLDEWARHMLCRPSRKRSRMNSYALSFLLAHHPGTHRPPARRELADRGRVEIAVRGQGERPRDRRGGHVQHVRRGLARALRVQRRAVRPRSGAARRRRRRRGSRTSRRARSGRVCRRPARARRMRAAPAPRGAGAPGSPTSAARTGSAHRRAAGRALPRVAPRASRSAPSARPGGPLPARATSRGPRPRCYE